MHLKSLIQGFFTEVRAEVYDASGKKVPQEKIHHEYHNLRAHLATRLHADSVVGLGQSFDYPYLLSLLACLDLGVTFVPLRSNWPNSRKLQIQELTGITHTLDDNSYLQMSSTRPKSRYGFSVYPEKTAYIMCTSGSTGLPKGVAISRNSLQGFSKWVDSYFKVKPNQKLLFVTDFTFDICFVDIFLLLKQQLPFRFSTFNQTNNIFALANEITEFQPEIINTVPNNLRMLLNDSVYGRANLGSLNEIILAGSRLSERLYKEVYTKIPKVKNLYNCYGPTEGTVYALAKRLNGNAKEEITDTNVSIGTPLHGTGCKLIDENNKEIREPYKKGELWISGPNLMQGYVKDIEKTKAALVKDKGVVFYKTGDLAFSDRNGNYYIAGRIDDTIKRRGCRINLSDIDSYIQKITSVSAVTSIAKAQDEFEYELVSFVIPNGDVSKTKLREELKSLLLNYQMPDRIEFIEQLPVNNSGKVCKKSLKKLVS